MSDPRLEIEKADAFTEPLIAKLQAHPKRIVFSDGLDPRVLVVAQEMVRLKVGVRLRAGAELRIWWVDSDGEVMVRVRVSVRARVEVSVR